MRTTACLILLTLTGAAFELPPPQPVRAVRSTFDNGVDGWTCPTPHGRLEVHESALRVTDITEEWLWIDAPDRFHGDWRGARAIRLRFRANEDSRLSESLKLEIGGVAGKATYVQHRRFLERGVWCDLQVPLEPGFWETDSDWNLMLAAITSFRIRVDLDGRTDAMETHDLDDIELVPQRRSTFTHDTEGWKATGGSVEARDGALFVTDGDDGWCWVRAPRRFRGDWGNARALTFRVCADRRRAPSQKLRVQIDSGGGMAIHQVPLDALEQGAWRTVRIPLDESRWALRGKLPGITADVSDLWIRLDLTDAGGGAEVTRLDDVVLER